MFSKSAKCKMTTQTPPKKICFSCVDVSIEFATKISMFKLRPFWGFLCLINSLYRRYVSCVYNICYYIYIIYIEYIYIYIYPIYPIYCFTISCYFLLFPTVSYYLLLFHMISSYFLLLPAILAKLGTTKGPPQNT